MFFPSIYYVLRTELSIEFGTTILEFIDIQKGILQILGVLGGLLFTISIFLNRFIISELQTIGEAYNEGLDKFASQIDILSKNSKLYRKLRALLKNLRGKEPRYFQRDDTFWDAAVSESVAEILHARIHSRTKEDMLWPLAKTENAVTKFGTVMIIVISFGHKVSSNIFSTAYTFFTLAFILLLPTLVDIEFLNSVIPEITLIFILRCAWHLSASVFTFSDFYKDLEITAVPF